MTAFSVFFVRLSDETTDMVNARGWSASEASNVYADIMTGFGGRADYNRAAEFGLYEFAAQVQALDCNDVWEIVQNHENPWHVDPRAVRITDRPRSMMVGDIILNNETKEFHVVAGIGFKELPATEYAVLINELGNQLHKVLSAFKTV